MNINFSQLLPHLVFPNEIYYKKGSLVRLKFLEEERIALFIGKGSLKKSGGFKKINDYLKAQSSQILTLHINCEPAVDKLQKITKKLQSFKADLIIACGGGSVLDTAKIARVLLENPKLDLLSYTHPHTLPQIEKRKIKLIAIPTNNGSGAEISWTAPIIDTKQNKKIPLTSSSLLPDAVILDPELTLTLPPKLTAAAALDSLIHALESYYSTMSNNFNNLYAVTAGKLIHKYLLKTLKEPRFLEGREMLQYAGLFAGIAQNSASTGAIHALSHTLGGILNIPHAFGNVVFITPVLKENAKHSPRSLAFLKEIGFNSLKDFLVWFEKIKSVSELDARWSKLSRSSVTLSLGEIASKVLEDVCMKTNPYEFSLKELLKILEETK